MERLNRKHLIERFESNRNGFAQACMVAAEIKDKVLLACMSAHHLSANKMVVYLGGEGVDLPDYAKLMNSNAPAHPRRAKH